MAEVLFRAKLVRQDASTPWGFRLQGGVEFDKPLTLLKVVPESIAAKSGLHAGDIVVKLAGAAAEGMTHKDAQAAIRNAGNALEIIVERGEEEITLSPPNSPPTVSAKDKPAHPEKQQDTSKTKPVLKEPKIDAVKVSPSNSPATQKKSVKFAEEVHSKEKQMLASQSPSQRRKNDVKKPNVTPITAQTKETPLIQDTHIPTNSDQTKAPVESSNATDTPQTAKSPETAKKIDVAKPPDRASSTASSISKSIQNVQDGVTNVNNLQDKNFTNAVELRQKEAKLLPTLDGSTIGPPYNKPPPPYPGSSTVNSNYSTLGTSVANGHIPSGLPVGSATVPSAKDNSSVSNNIKAKPDVQSLGQVRVSAPTVMETTFKVKQNAVSEPPVHEVRVTKEMPHVPESNFVAVDESRKDTNTGSSAVILEKSESTPPNVKNTSTTQPTVRGIQTVTIAPPVTITMTNPVYSTSSSVAGTAVAMLPSQNTPSSENKVQTASGIISHSSPPDDRVPLLAHETGPDSVVTASVSVSVPTLVSATPPGIVTIATSPVSVTTVRGTPPGNGVTPASPSSIRAIPPANTAPASASPASVAPTSAMTSSVPPKSSAPLTGSASTQPSRTVSASASADTRAPDIAPTPVSAPTTVSHPTSVSASVSHTNTASTPVTANDGKDFSQIAPWRVSQRKREPTGLPQVPPPLPMPEGNLNPLHPWRKPKGEIGARPRDTTPVTSSSTGGGKDSRQKFSGGSVPVSSAPVPATEVKPSLILVGKRIESPTGTEEFTFSETGPGYPPTSQSEPTGRAGQEGPKDARYTSLPTSKPESSTQLGPTTSLPSPAQQFIEQIISYKPAAELFESGAENVGDPELMGIPMPTVKEMVADLHRRLEDIAIQHPKIAELITPQELGLNFYKKHLERLRSDALSGKTEREIIIDCPPNYTSTLSVDDSRRTRSFLSPSFGTNTPYDISTSPDLQRRRYSLPGTYLSAPRRVHFADPVESSVVEIEARTRDGIPRRRGELPPPSYSSASSLAEKLDRIERENAMASAAMNVSRSSRDAQGQRSRLNVPHVQTHRISPPRMEQILFSSTRPLGEDISYRPQAQGGSRGISVSFGGDGQSQIRLSFSHDRSSPVIQTSRLPPGGAQLGSRAPGFSYSISTSDTRKNPQGKTFSYSTKVQEPHPGRVEGERYLMREGESLRLSPSFHSPTPGDVSPRGVRTGSPRLDPYYQYRGSPTQAPNYSHTLQIDTRTRGGDHSPRAPSPVYSFPPPQMHSTPPVDTSHQRPRAFPAAGRPREVGGFPSGPASMPPGHTQPEPPAVKVSKYYTDAPTPIRAPGPRGPVGVPGPRPMYSPTSGPGLRPQVPPVPAPPPLSPAKLGATAPLTPAAAAASAMPGLFALFDKSFADKFLEWQDESNERSQNLSETYKLVQEMDEEKQYWGGDTYS